MFKEVDQGLVANSSIATKEKPAYPGRLMEMFSEVGAIKKLPIETFYDRRLAKKTRRDWYKREERGGCSLVNHTDRGHTSLMEP